MARVPVPPPPTAFHAPVLQPRAAGSGVAPPPTRFAAASQPPAVILPARRVIQRMIALNAAQLGLTGAITTKFIGASHNKKIAVVDISHSGVDITATVNNKGQDTWDAGLLQAVTLYSGKVTYANGRQYTYSFPHVPIKDAYSAKSKFYDGAAHKTIKPASSITVSLSDLPFTSQRLTDPRDLNSDLVMIEREQDFFIWLWAFRKGMDEFHILDTFEWGVRSKYQAAGNILTDNHIVPNHQPGLQAVVGDTVVANKSTIEHVHPP